MGVNAGMKVSKIGSRISLAFNKLLTRAFSDKYLLLTNVSLSVSLSAIGDVIEQNYEIMTAKIDRWDQIRTRNMSISGFTIGIFCHVWYRYLDKFIPGYSLKIVLKKVAVDQLIASPVCISTFFLTIGALEYTSREELIQEIRNKAWKLYAAEWMIWPPAQFVNFYLLPYKYRVLFDNGISLCYDIFTSHVKYENDPKDAINS